MADRIGYTFLGLWNAMTATGIGYSVWRGEVEPGWVFLAAAAAWVSIACAAAVGASRSIADANQKGGEQ